MYVCLCRGITDQDIKDAVSNGAESYRAVRDLLDLGTCCGRCAPEARAIISDELSDIAARILLQLKQFIYAVLLTSINI